LNKIKYSYSPETPPTIRRISNSCKFAEYSHVVECEYELRHIPNVVCIVYCGVISSCQWAAMSEIDVRKKHCWTFQLSRCTHSTDCSCCILLGCRSEAVGESGSPLAAVVDSVLCIHPVWQHRQRRQLTAWHGRRTAWRQQDQGLAPTYFPMPCVQ